MKTIEEKAKAYDEALERCRKLYNEAKANEYNQDLEDYEIIFPELKGSEDERIRKEIIDYINRLTASPNNIDKYNTWLAWLEKQGESYTKRDVNDAYLEGVCDAKQELEKQGETSDQIHYWTEEEIEPIISDYLRGAEHYGGMIGRLRCLKPKSLEKQGEQKSINYNEELKKCRENPLYFIDKYVKLEERKPAWSKDDENVLEDIEEAIINYWHGDTQDILLDWLKSIKQRIKGE